MSNIVISEENTYEAMEEAYALAEAHYYEVEARASDMEFKLDLSLMYEYMKHGVLFLYLARDWTGQVVGYFCNQILPDPYTSQLVGREFGIFVSPEWRNKGVYPKLLKKAEEGIKQRGGQLQYLSFKYGHDTGLAEKSGYSPTETVYQKILEG